MVNYLTHIEGFSLETSGLFSHGRKTDAKLPRLNRFNPEERCQIASSLSKTDTSLRRTVRAIPKVSVLEGVYCTDLSQECWEWPFSMSTFSRSSMPWKTSKIIPLHSRSSSCKFLWTKVHLTVNSTNFYVELVCTLESNNTWWGRLGIQRVKSSKSLGLHIDEVLTWRGQVNCITKKVIAGLAVLRRTKNLVDHHTLHITYNLITQPYFDYCSQVKSGIAKNLSSKLQRLSSTLHWSN